MKHRIFSSNNINIKYYHFPAKNIGSPLLVIFHGVGYNTRPARFRDERYNVIALMDTFGYAGKGSWYLGEQGNYFWVDMLPQLLLQLKEECQTKDVFFWGSSMGGYGALLHGYLNNVTAVYANVPQTRLLGSQYVRHGIVEKDKISMQQCVEYAVEADSQYNNLINVFHEKKDTVFFITFNQLEGLNYFTEQGFSFLRKLHDLRQPFYLEVHPQKAHGIIYNVAEGVDLFDRILNKVD